MIHDLSLACFKNSACLIFYNLNKPEPIVIVFGTQCHDNPSFASNLMFTILLCNFQRGGNDIFSHIAAIFEDMPFNKEYRILVKKLYLLKECTTQELLKEFPSPTKSWNKRSLRMLLKTRAVQIHSSDTAYLHQLILDI